MSHRQVLLPGHRSWLQRHQISIGPRPTRVARGIKRSGKFTHSVIRHVKRRTMEVEAKSDAKRQKKNHHEAHMIPGVDGHRIFGFPNTIITKLRYSTYITLTNSSGARGLNVFHANSIFDPDVSGVGHQPMWRDNYANIYNNYVVIGSKITVTFCGKTSGVNQIYGIVADDDSSISVTGDALLEMNNSVSACGGPTISGCEPVTLTSTFEPLEAFGVDAKDDGASATNTGSSPSQGFYWGVWAVSMDASSTSLVDIKVEIDYTVKFTELITQGLS